MKALLIISLAGFAAWPASALAQGKVDPKMAEILEPIRGKYHLPCLAGAIFTTDGVIEMAAVGVRKAGTDVPVTADDLWHLGSDTKAMTATLAGSFVAEKRLAWTDKVASFFPEIAEKIPPAMKEVTVAQVLSHQAGLLTNLPIEKVRTLTGSVSERRLSAAQTLLETPEFPPGTYRYSNGDYVVIGAMLEKIAGKPWEDLMRERLFVPLHMDSAGFGGTGTVGKIDQPWPHMESGIPTASNGPAIDNRPYMATAANVHCSMTDWGKFLADQLRGARGMPALLPKEIYTAIQSPAPKSDYGFGWSIGKRIWSAGTVFGHSGSNTMNYATCLVVPAEGFGVLVCTNQAGDGASAPCHEALEAIITAYLAGLKSKWHSQKMTKLRQGFCWWCFADRGTTPEALLAGAAKIGYEGVDLLEEALWPVARDNGLTVAAVAGHGTLDDGLNRRENAERIEIELLTNIDKAAEWKIPVLICFSGKRDGLSEEAGLIVCAETLGLVAPRAAEAGVTLAVELLNSKVDHPGYQCDHTEWGVRLCRHAASPAVRLLYDVYHMQIMEGDVIRTIHDNHEYFAHYHTAGNPGRGPLDATQELNYRAIGKAIAETGFEGFVSHEFRPAQGTGSLEALSQAFAELDT